MYRLHNGFAIKIAMQNLLFTVKCRIVHWHDSAVSVLLTLS